MDENTRRQMHAVRRSGAPCRGSLRVLIDLAENDGGSGTVGVWHAVPDQHPVVAGVGGDHEVAVGPDRAWGVHVGGGRHRRRKQEPTG